MRLAALQTKTQGSAPTPVSPLPDQQPILHTQQPRPTNQVLPVLQVLPGRSASQPNSQPTIKQVWGQHLRAPRPSWSQGGPRERGV